MPDKISAITGTVMLHIRNFKKEKQIASLCKSMGLSVRYIKQGDADKTIGRLCSPGTALKPAARQRSLKAPSGYKLPDIIIFSGLADETLDMFLAEYKAACIETVEIKAVVTQTNIAWSVYELICSIEKEINGADTADKGSGG